MDSGIAIKVDNVTKIYKLYDKPEDRLKEALNPFRKSYHKDFYALNNISFDIKKGETIGIIGKNGSGKSTILKIITGVLNPTCGDVIVNGKISALLELGAGFNPEYSGIENIYLNGSIMGYTKQEMDLKLKSITEFADIGDFIYQPVKTYSSGMFARLAFAVAINIDPDILIVDEALAVGDAKFQNKCYIKFREFIELKKTIIIVSHSVEMLRSLCTRIIWINEGNFYKEGEPKVLTQEYLDFMTHDILKTESEYNEDQQEDAIEENSWQWINLDGFERSGNGEAKIIAVAFIDKDTNKSILIADENTKNLSVKFKIKTFEDISVPLIAFGIVNKQGETILHSNTEVNDIKIDDFNKNKEYIINYDFTLPRIKNGDYHLAISLDKGIIGFSHEVLDRLNDTINFKILATDTMSKQYGYCLINDISFEVKRVN